MNLDLMKIFKIGYLDWDKVEEYANRFGIDEKMIGDELEKLLENGHIRLKIGNVENVILYIIFSIAEDIIRKEIERYCDVCVIEKIDYHINGINSYIEYEEFFENGELVDVFNFKKRIREDFKIK
jgi:hypothetical protein